MTQQPQAKYRHDYRAPDYQITDIDLTFDLDAQRRSLPRSAGLSVMVHQMLRFVSTAKTSNWFLFILMMSRGPPERRRGRTGHQ